MKAKNGTKRGAAEGLRNGVRLLLDARVLIREARSRAGRDIQSRLLGLYWELGRRLRRASRAEAAQGAPGKRVRAAGLARALTLLYGRAYGEEALLRMERFAECYPTRASRLPLSGLLWSHVVALLALDKPQERGAYASECLRRGWSPALLRERIRDRWYARGAWSRERPRQAGKGRTEAEVSRAGWDFPAADPDGSDFLGYAGPEPRDRRGAVIRAMEEHFLNLPAGFCLVERRKRFQVGADDFYLDLLLYHRDLKRLFALVFEWPSREAGPKDLMDFYLAWLDRNERRPGENAPVGILFRADEAGDRLSLRNVEGEGRGVAWYQTALPPRVLLHRFYAQAVDRAAALEPRG